MQTPNKPEVWLRGPVEGFASTLQPAVHALLQAQEELHQLGPQFPDALLWEKPAGVASVGYHLQHMRGVLDRLLTYARNESLSEIQLDYLKREGTPPFSSCTFKDLLTDLDGQLAIALEQLRDTRETSLTEICFVGRAQIPSTRLGLIFHAAEHTQRHLGQLLVTARILLYEQATQQ